MQKTLYLLEFQWGLGKLTRRHALAATVASGSSPLFRATDVMTKVNHLVDTGTEVSTLPAMSSDIGRQPASTLQAAYGKPTAAYGKRYVYLNLGLRGPIHWIFTLAIVSTPMIGIDLLEHYNLLGDTR